MQFRIVPLSGFLGAVHFQHDFVRIPIADEIHHQRKTKCNNHPASSANHITDENEYYGQCCQ